MTRSILAIGVLASLMGVAVIFPVLMARLESGATTAVGFGVVAAGCGLIAGGIAAVRVGLRRPQEANLPSGARAALAADGAFLVFFALELSDRLVRQDGRIVYWTTFLFPPALLLFYGLLATRPWAWRIARAVAALGVVWFLGFAAVIPVANLQANGVPAPWHGRLYMICVSVVFAGIMACAFWSLGRSETRNYFGLQQSHNNEAAKSSAAADRGGIQQLPTQ